MQCVVVYMMVLRGLGRGGDNVLQCVPMSYIDGKCMRIRLHIL